MNNTKKKISLVDAIRSITSSAVTMLPAILPLLSGLMLNSCSDDNMISQSQLVQGITVSSEDFDFVQTRSAYSVDESGFHFTWAPGDTIGIYPVGGDQVSFPISGGDGSATAQFDGGAWALRSSYSYSAYYPFSDNNYHIKETSLPVSYVGQTQNGNGSLTRIGRYDYQASVATRPSADGYVNIQMKHLGCFVRFQVTMPEADSFSAFEITSDRTPFVTAGTFNLTSAMPSITARSTAKTIRVNLSDTRTASKGQVLTVYCMMAPVDLSDSKLAIKVYGSSNRTYSATVDGKTMVAGKAYSYVSQITSGTNVNGEDVAWDENGNIFMMPQYVDLGLPSGTLWATFNIGANKPEEYGDYFAWGATEPFYEHGYAQENPQRHWKPGKSAGYTFFNTPYQTADAVDWRDGDITKWTKYLGSTSSKYKDPSATDANALKFILDPEDDAAHVNWGDSWRMPTKEDFDELMNTDNCTWTWTTMNGVNGYKVQGKKPGYTDKWIFFPAAGARSVLDLSSVGSYGYYWSSTVSASAAYLISLNSSSVGWERYNRYTGHPIRPVYSEGPSAGITGISLNKSSVSIQIIDKETLIATVSKGNVVVNSPVEWSSSDESVAVVDIITGMVTAVSIGTTTITAKTVFGGYTASCVVEVTPIVYPETGISNGYEYVDLGLSVKWATINVGATKPEGYGDYFAWGATEPLYESGYAQENPQQHWKPGKSAGYTDFNTPYQISSTKFTKYLGSKSSGYKDPSATDVNALKTVLDPEDDAAHVNWGGNWRMPTKEEQDELHNGENCTWTRINLNGVNGYKVQSKKPGYTDKWIFLPAAGYRSDSNLNDVGSYGYYWSSSLYTGDPRRAYYLRSDVVGYNYSNYRYFGRSVRPVCP